MKFRCRLSQQSGGQWSARYEGKDLGAVAVEAPGRDEAIDKLRDELRYRLELCPCSGESYQHLEIEIVET